MLLTNVNIYVQVNSHLTHNSCRYMFLFKVILFSLIAYIYLIFFSYIFDLALIQQDAKTAMWYAFLPTETRNELIKTGWA